jgi:hypothetical protein
MGTRTREYSKNSAPYVNCNLWMGTVVSTDPAVNIVHVAPDGEKALSHVQAIPLVSQFCAALGFNETMLPTVGTRVYCAGNGLSALILGAVPFAEMQGDPNSAILPNKAILGVSEAAMDSVHTNGMQSINKCIVTNNGLPTDVSQGEKVISNEFGVMLGLFKLMATLKGSELAQIQCHFLDDLVRIISHNFQHYTSLGSVNVFHDGQGIHLEMGASHIPAESLGQTSTSGINSIPPDSNNTYDQFFSLSDPQLVMLERMKLFVGKLGQFINLMIVDPAQIPHAINGQTPSLPDTGLLQVKASLDGTLVVRSVNGIYLEKTNWIRVPTRIRAPEDPLGDDGTQVDYPDKAAYTFDESYSYLETGFLYYLQLKDYLAYINEEVGYANFNAQVKDFYVNKDINNETPLSSITYIDQETGIAFKQTKSWVSLMGNGGISLADAWGSCISMEGGNIYIQPAKDLVLQPNRNLVAKVGGNLGVAAQGELDLSSTSGGLRVKTNNAQYLYSQNGGILLHTDGSQFSPVTQNYPGSGMITAISGIVFNAPNSGINSYGQQIYLNAVQNLVVAGPDITLDASDALQLLSDNNLVMYGNEILTLSTTECINYSSGSNILLGMGNTSIGIVNQDFGVANISGGQIPVTGLIDPNNNLDKQFFTDLNKELNFYDSYKPSSGLSTFKADTDFTNLKFQFPPTKLYNIDQSVDVIPQTLSQQMNDLVDLSLRNWTEQSVNDSYPYPGSGFPNSLATVALNNINPAAGDISLANKAVDLVSKSKIVVQNIFNQYKSM